MKSLKDFINIVDEAVLRSSDGKPVTDGSGKVVGTGSTTPEERVAAQAEVDRPAAPAAAPATRGIGNVPADTTATMAQTPGAVNPALQPEPLKPPSTGASADGNAGELDAQANAAKTPPAQAAQPVNRDSMKFGQAFKDARSKGESVFTWKGKKYTTQLAPSKPTAPAQVSKGQSGMLAPSTGSTLTPQQDAQIKALMAQRVSAYQKGDTATVANIDKAIQQWGQGVTQSQTKPASESVGYAEDQNLVSIVHLAGLR